MRPRRATVHQTLVSGSVVVRLDEEKNPGDVVGWATDPRATTTLVLTALNPALRSRDVRRIALCGQVTEQCILYSSLDAYLRGFEVAVPPDAVAHIHEDLADAALEMMRRNMHADLAPAERCELAS